jgi:hypothetical protein
MPILKMSNTEMASCGKEYQFEAKLIQNPNKRYLAVQQRSGAYRPTASIKKLPACPGAIQQVML